MSLSLQNRAGLYGKSIGHHVPEPRKPTGKISLKWSDVDPIRPFAKFSKPRLHALTDTLSDLMETCLGRGDVKRYRAAETLWNACLNETDQRDGFRPETELVISDAEFNADKGGHDALVGDPR